MNDHFVRRNEEVFDLSVNKSKEINNQKHSQLLAKEKFFVGVSFTP